MLGGHNCTLLYNAPLGQSKSSNVWYKMDKKENRLGMLNNYFILNSIPKLDINNDFLNESSFSSRQTNDPL